MTVARSRIEYNRIRQYPDTESFHWHNENPKGMITSDCVIRAISQATGKDWETVTRELTEKAITEGSVCNDKDVYIPYIEELGFEKHRQPRKADNSKYTGSEFCRLLDKECKHNEIIIAHIGGYHIVCICRGEGKYKINDTWNCTGKCIGNYWTK